MAEDLVVSRNESMGRLRFSVHSTGDGDNSMIQVICCSFRGISTNLGLGNASLINLIKNGYVAEDGHMFMLTV